MIVKKNQFYIILLVFVAITLGIACDCPKKLGFNDADYVFYGKVIKKEKEEVEDFFPLIKVTFKIDSIFKGNISRTYELIILEDSKSCGKEFNLFENYYIFTEENRSLYSVFTNICYPVISQKNLDTNEFERKRLMEAFQH